jgi:hypothetical protein
MDHLSFNDYMTLLVIVAGTVTTVASLAWAASQYFARQFNSTRQLIDSKIEKLEVNILNKLEYHEKHDDQRFSAISDDIWDIRVRNAARDGSPNLVRERHKEK